MKRKASDRLTGGTDDVNPQWFKLTSTQDVTQTVLPGGTLLRRRTQRFNLPVQRINQSDKNTATIIELLKVRWSYSLDTSTISGDPSAFSYAVGGYLSTAPIADEIDAPQSRGTTVDWFQIEGFVQPFAVNATSNSIAGYNEKGNEFPIVHDLTDGDGHGILVATDGITLLSSGQLTNEYPSGASGVVWSNYNIAAELLYRYKKVSLTEFIGVVQSQER